MSLMNDTNDDSMGFHPAGGLIDIPERRSENALRPAGMIFPPDDYFASRVLDWTSRTSSSQWDQQNDTSPSGFFDGKSGHQGAYQQTGRSQPDGFESVSSHDDCPNRSYHPESVMYTAHDGQ